MYKIMSSLHVELIQELMTMAKVVAEYFEQEPASPPPLPNMSQMFPFK